MQYTQLEQLSNGEFKRLCGVSRGTFGEMVEILRPQLDRSGKRGGQAKLSVEDQLLVAMEYCGFIFMDGKPVHENEPSGVSTERSFILVSVGEWQKQQSALPVKWKIS